MKVNELEWRWIKLNEGEWRLMKANEGVRRKMKVNEGKWGWKKVNERQKWKVKEVEEAMLGIEVSKSLWEMSGKMGHVATC